MKLIPTSKKESFPLPLRNNSPSYSSIIQLFSALALSPPPSLLSSPVSVSHYSLSLCSALLSISCHLPPSTILSCSLALPTFYVLTLFSLLSVSALESSRCLSQFSCICSKSIDHIMEQSCQQFLQCTSSPTVPRGHGAET